MQEDDGTEQRSLLRRFWQPYPGSADRLSTAASFDFPVGERVAPGSVAGYHIDFRAKAESARWPPQGLPGRDRLLFVGLIQWGLGCYEHFLASGDEEWLDAARSTADMLLSTQEREGRLVGAWLHRFRLEHTYELKPPWLSGMAQGEGASLLVRIAKGTGDESYAEAARLALQSMRVPSSEGGAFAQLDGGFFPEEYPTTPPSFVLNGAIFALWGYYDVAVALTDGDAMESFGEGVDTLAHSLERFDTGYWSRYDLFPHPIISLASSGYHHLHVNQLRAMSRIAPRPQIAEREKRFQRYLDSRLNLARASGHKVLFRLLVPRNRLLAHRLPWSHREPR